jgi:hypothetical protein
MYQIRNQFGLPKICGEEKKMETPHTPLQCLPPHSLLDLIGGPEIQMLKIHICLTVEEQNSNPHG